MDRHLFSIDVATTQKIYLDIWRNIKNQPSYLSYPNLLEINKIAYSEVVEKVCLQIISRGRVYYYFMREDNIPNSCL